MATYHCSIKSGSKGSGANSNSKASYICREGKYADKPDLEYKESGNMPEWAQKNPRAFWKASDKHERANGRLYTEIELALPRYYSTDEHKTLIQGFIKEQLQGHPYTVAIHKPKAALDGDDQPHAHIIFSERRLDGIERDKEQFFKRANAKEPEKGGTAKDRKWNDREKVQAVREAWERHHNKAVFSDDQITCKSLKAQGIDREPERHLGPKMARSLMADKIIEIRSDREALDRINKEMQDLSREIEKAKVAQVPPVKIFVPEAQSEALPPQNKNKPSPQQLAVDLPAAPALTAAELAYHAVLRRIAVISQNFIALYNSLVKGDLLGGEEKYNDRTDQLEAELKKLIAPYPGTKIDIPYDDTPIIVNGQPITELVEGLPPEQKPEPPPPTHTPAKVMKR